MDKDFEIETLKGKLLVPLVEAAKILGYKKQTAYNMKCRGVFPVPIKKVCGKPMVRTADLMRYVYE